MASAQIQVRRGPQRYPDALRSYAVVLDGNPVGKVARGESITVDTEPGTHSLRMKIDWARSRDLELVLTDGQTIAVECWPSAGLLMGLLWPYWLTLGRTRYVGIKILHDAPTLA
jgi:hypothetical protein